MPKRRATNPSRRRENELSRRWRQEGEQYVSAINAFVARSRMNGGAEDEPKDPRQPMAKAVLRAVRRANRSGNIDGLRERFPPAHEPFIEMLDENGLNLPMVLMLDDSRILVRIGSNHDDGAVVIIDNLKVRSVGSDILTIGRSPNREFFAVARHKGVTIHRGWDGPITATLKWPTRKEGVPKGFSVTQVWKTLVPEKLVPFDTGDKSLLVSSDGVFVLTTEKAIRLVPTEQQMRERFRWQKNERPNRRVFYNVSMQHGSLSPQGELIAAGHQDGPHFLFDAKSLEIVGEIGCLSRYANHAAFSGNGKVIALSSCQFCGAATIGVPARLMPGLKTEPHSLDKRFTKLNDNARICASAFRNDEFIFGDTGGYLFAVDVKGHCRWQHFIGSTVCDIDVSSDGKRLAVTTYAGFLCILDLDTGQTDPFAIGTSTHRERRRWLFWNQESIPLAW